MAKDLSHIILIPYVASGDDASVPKAEAQFFYEEHFRDAEVVQIVGEGLEGRLYVKDEVGLYIIGVGKTNAAINCTALLREPRFDLSNTKFILCGCCGSAYGRGVPGDIYFATATVDMDLAHVSDPSDVNDGAGQTGYINENFTEFAHKNLNNGFLNSAFSKVENEVLKTTKNAKAFMEKSFENEDWAIRDPQIIKATTVTSDSYWKGMYYHSVANRTVEYYKCEDPYFATQMEDSAVANVFDKFNRLDDLLIIRYSVNMDVFMKDQSPETLWGNKQGSFDENSFDNFDDIFPVVSKAATDLTWKIIN